MAAVYVQASQCDSHPTDASVHVFKRQWTYVGMCRGLPALIVISRIIGADLE